MCFKGSLYPNWAGRTLPELEHWLHCFSGDPAQGQLRVQGSSGREKGPRHPAG